MVFTKKMIIVLLCLCAMIEYNHAQDLAALFNCTFDEGTIDGCFLNVTASIFPDVDAGPVIDSTENDGVLARPLSDVTSAYSPTKSGDTCAFPNQVAEWNVHFCERNGNSSNFTCETSTGTQLCESGQYAYLTSSSGTGFQETYETREIYHSAPEESQCLTFYYYFTNDTRNASIELSLPNGTSTFEDSVVPQATPPDRNQWHKYTKTLTISETNYTVQFQFSVDDSSETDPFYIAIDNIGITTGICVDENPTTSSPTTTISSVTDIDSGELTTENGGIDQSDQPSLTTTTIQLDFTGSASPSVTSNTGPPITRNFTISPNTSAAPNTTGTTTTSPRTSTTSPSRSTTTTTANNAIIHGLSFGISLLSIITYLINIV